MVTATIAPEHVLADVQAIIASKAADAGVDAAITVGDPSCQYHLGRLSMAREIAVWLGTRIEGLTAPDADPTIFADNPAAFAAECAAIRAVGGA